MSVLPIATTDQQGLSAGYQAVLATFLGSESHFTAVRKECATPPHVHPTPRYVTAHDQFSPTLVLQVTNTGVRRPGCKANEKFCTETKDYIMNAMFISVLNWFPPQSIQPLYPKIVWRATQTSCLHLLEQLSPFPEYPELQAQVKLPIVSIQMALLSQGWLRHSSLSIQAW